MSTLLLRFAAPMQSWGSGSRFDIRKTEREPTKSGAIGLLAAALGRRRDADISDLAEMRYGVRTDKVGVLLRDFHIARKFKKEKLDSSYVTYRYYLCDAVFLVGFESNRDDFLVELQESVTHPAFPLFLGRRSCPPEGKLCLGIRELPLEEALTREPLLAENNGEIRILTDAPAGTERPAIMQDLPVSYNPNCRKYTYRGVCLTILESSEHDPMIELE